MKTVMRLFFVTLVCVSLVPLASAQCGFTSELNVTQTAGTTGPFGDVCVDLTSSTTATITFTAASNYQFIDSSIVGVQVNATSFNQAFVSEAPNSLHTPTVDLNQNVNGYGVFNLTWDNFDGAANAEDTFVFTVTNTGGTWGSTADVLTANSSGFDAEAHVICRAGSGCETAGVGGVPLTFFVAEGTPVPEPRFYGLLLTGLMGLVGKTLFRRRAT